MTAREIWEESEVGILLMEEERFIVGSDGGSVSIWRVL
jgi:hypothetical protein